VLVIRQVTFLPAFTGAIHSAIREQATLGYDSLEHERAAQAMVHRFSTDELWVRCAVRCRGGD
jgi:hypothetical protein